MPIFEYLCMQCGSAFEKLIAGPDTPVACEQCGSIRVDKQFSTFSPSVATHTMPPCSTSGCPANGMAGTGCSGGKCPIS